MNSGKLKILQICHRVPYPPVDGGNIVMMNMALALTEAGHEVHQFALNTSKHFINPSEVPEDIQRKLHFRAFFIDTKITAKAAFRNLFTDESYNIVRFYSEDVAGELRLLLQKHTFDIVQLETLFSAPYISVIRELSNAKIVLRAHNVEHIIWSRLAKSEKHFAKKRYIRFLANRLKKYELSVLKEIDALIPITKVDEQLFRNFHFTGPVLTLPLGVNYDEYQLTQTEESEMAVFHLGSMDWLPNLEGVEWFLNSCWPALHRLLPDLKLYLAGRAFPAHIIQTHHPNVICEGRIEDAKAYMSRRQIMVVPLHSGSGMRVKIIQGLAMGKTIISTTIGAEGIDVTPEKNILIADTPGDFVAMIRRCVENEAWCRKIGMNGRELVRQKYSNEVMGKMLGEFYADMLKLSPAENVNAVTG